MSLILVADDDFGILELLQTVLQDEGYETAAAGSGREALAYLASSRRPDLVLSDLMMPAMNGRELFRTMLANPDYREIPFVLMTAVVSAAERDRLPYAAVLAKPFDLETLLDMVRKALREGPAAASGDR